MTTAPGTLVKLLHAYQDRNAGEVFVTDATTAAALIDADLAVEETHVPSETFHGKDQLFIHAWNSTASDVNVTVYVGETAVLTRAVPANEVKSLLDGERQFMPGDVIKAQAATADAITITGHTLRHEG